MDTIKNTTIAAIATPTGTGGIGIIRISGSQAVPIITRIFRRKFHRNSKSNHFESHKIYYGEIYNIDTLLAVDEVIMFIMKSPFSYTKEDVVEIQAHGGPLILRSILELIISNGAVLAEAGEFTKRAFLNGRLDLTQAESVIDVINSKTKASLHIAVSQLNGNVNGLIKNIRTQLIEKLTQIEAILDFPEEVEDTLNTKDLLDFFESDVRNPLSQIIQNYQNFHVLREGYKVAIIGSPNVGKSSLMNCLLDKDKSIVTSIPGTTRDLIDDFLYINGVPILLSDTAGLHRTDDIVENIGIEKTSKLISQTDIVLFVIEANSSITENELEIYNLIKNKNHLIIINKIDLVGSDYSQDFSVFNHNTVFINISAKYKKGIDDIRSAISDLLNMSDIQLEDKIIPNLRQKKLIELTDCKIQSAISGLKNVMPYELIAIDLNDAIRLLSEIIGDTYNIDILDNIFSNFCIGK